MTNLSNEAQLVLGNLGNLTKRDNLNGGYRYAYQFPNGFGVSIIKSYMSYGGDEDSWEIGVLDRKGGLTYDTDITDDVVGYLTEESVIGYAKQIASLNEKGRLPGPSIINDYNEVMDLLDAAEEKIREARIAMELIITKARISNE